MNPWQGLVWKDTAPTRVQRSMKPTPRAYVRKLG